MAERIRQAHYLATFGMPSPNRWGHIREELRDIWLACADAAAGE